MYRHALPPGFVLKKDKKKEEKEDEISLEDLIEREVSKIFYYCKTKAVFIVKLQHLPLGGNSILLRKRKKNRTFSPKVGLLFL